MVDLLHPAKELDRRPRLLGHVVAQLDVFALQREQLKRTVPRLRPYEITQPISHPFDPHPCKSRLNESWKSPRKMLGPAVSQRKLVPDDDRMTCQNVVRSRPDLLAGIHRLEINVELGNEICPRLREHELGFRQPRVKLIGRLGESVSAGT